MGPRCGGAKGPAGGALTEGGRVDRQEEGSRTREADGDARGGGDKGPKSGACRRKVIEWTVRGEGQDTGPAGCSTKDRQVGARRAGPLHRGRMGRQVNLSARWPARGPYGGVGAGAHGAVHERAIQVELTSQVLTDLQGD